MYFVAICRDRANALETWLANRPAHLEFLKAHRERIKVGGPFLSPDGERMISRLMILEIEAVHESLDELHRIVWADVVVHGFR